MAHDPHDHGSHGTHHPVADKPPIVYALMLLIPVLGILGGVAVLDYFLIAASIHGGGH